MMTLLLMPKNFINYRHCTFRNIDRKMKVQTEENFQKAIMDEITNLEKALEQK